MSFVNDSNRVDANFIYRIDNRGELHVDYKIETDVQTTYLPMVGMQMKMAKGTVTDSWYGKGPQDAYPNKQAAPIMGMWDAKNMTGTRHIKSLTLSNGSAAMTINADAYCDRDDMTSDILRIVHHVLGRSEKGRLNELHYRVTPKGTYRGKFTIK